MEPFTYDEEERIQGMVQRGMKNRAKATGKQLDS